MAPGASGAACSLFENRLLPERDPNPALTWILGLIYIPCFHLARCLGELNMGYTFPFIVLAKHDWILFQSFFILTKMSVLKTYY